MREAKLRAQHNKQRAQLKGYIRSANYSGYYGYYGYYGYMTTYHHQLPTTYHLPPTTYSPLLWLRGTMATAPGAPPAAAPTWSTATYEHGYLPLWPQRQP